MVGLFFTIMHFSESPLAKNKANAIMQAVLFFIDEYMLCPPRKPTASINTGE